MALALQYAIPVADLQDVPRSVDRLVRDMDREMTAIEREQGLTLDQAESRINALIAGFGELAASLDIKRDAAVEMTSPEAAPLGTPVVISPTVGPTPSVLSPVPTSTVGGTVVPTTTAGDTGAPMTAQISPTLAPSATPTATAPAIATTTTPVATSTAATP